MRATDVPLTTSSGKPTSVLELLDEMKQRWSAGDAARNRARVIRRWTMNRLDGRSLALETNVSLPLNAPLVSKNKLRNARNTWAARCTKHRDTAMAWPNEATQGDVARADVANGVLDYIRQLQDRDALMLQALREAGTDGTVGLYQTWDPDHGPHKEREVVLDRYGIAPLRDAMGQIVYREVEGRGAPNLEVLSIFDFVTSGEKEAHKGKWLLVRRWLDPDEAECLLRARHEQLQAEHPGEPIGEMKATVTKVEDYDQVSGEARDAVEAYEMWWRPNDMGRLPKGLFAAVVSGFVVNHSDFPYAHGELPIAIIRTEDDGDRFYGVTWMEDVVPQQMGLNHSLAVTAERAEAARRFRILMTKNVAQKWNDDVDGFIGLDDLQEVQGGAKPIEVPAIPRDMFEMSDRYERGIDDTAGVSAVASSGDVAAETKNARLVAYATQVDEQKNEHTMRNIQCAELIIDKQGLEEFQQFVPKQRLIRVIGEDKAFSADYFSGAEIRGVDVRLYTAPGAERTAAAQAKSTEEGAAAGYIDPARASEMRQTGLTGTVDEGEQRQRVGLLIQQALSGQPVQADMTINPDVAVRELKMAIERYTPAGPQVVRPLQALAYQYEEMKRQGAQQQMPVGPPQQGQPGMTQKPQQNVLPSAAGAPQ